MLSLFIMSKEYGGAFSAHGHIMLGVSALWVKMIQYQKSTLSVKMFGEAIGNNILKRKL
jgi:hypothetical protein